MKNHYYENADKSLSTPNRGGVIKPEGIVLHDTAGASGSSSANWLCNPRARASAHFVIDRSGKGYQLAPCNIKTWHAGASSYNGRRNCNGFTIGIEIDNPGRLTSTGRASFGKRYDGFEHKVTSEHGDHHWLPYTADQIEFVTDLCVDLVDYYDINFLTTHWEISPGRKIDPGPLYPVDELRAKLFGRQDVPTNSDGETRVALNLRAWPSTGSRIIDVLPKGSQFDIQRSGWFNGAKWLLVVTPENAEGWIHSGYVKLY